MLLADAPSAPGRRNSPHPIASPGSSEAVVFGLQILILLRARIFPPPADHPGVRRDYTLSSDGVDLP